MTYKDKIRVLLCVPSPNDGTSYYRSSLPFIALENEYPDIYVEVISPLTTPIQDWNIWNILWKFDVVVMQRPSDWYSRDLAIAALELGLPIIFDFDDALTHVPVNNPNTDHYNSKETRECMQNILGMRSAFWNRTTNVDDKIGIMVSTPYLGGLLEKIGSVKTTVVPNALYDEKMGEPFFASKPTSKCDVSWRGSNTHQKDLEVYRDQIQEAFKSVEYIGSRPIIARPQDVVVNSFTIIRYYTLCLKQRSRKYFFVTLEDNEFNRSKSSIAFLEAAWGGAITLAPDWEEWRRPGIINYKDQSDFVVKAKEMMAMSDKEREDKWLEAKNYIMENLLMKHSNKIRYNLIRQMIGRPVKETTQ